MMNSLFPRLYQTGHWPAFMRGLLSLIGVLLLSAILLSQTAYAAGSRQAVTHKVQFNQTDIAPVRSIDWRTPAAALTFDMPANDWVDDVELLLSARPMGKVSGSTPLLVRFNDAPPIPLETGGHGFDARITLDRRHIHQQSNTVSVEYQTPSGEACLGPGHGAWDIDLKDSVVVVKSHSQIQALNFADLKSYVSAPATQPKSIGIMAKGTNKTNLEALAAQGISRNLGAIPNFRIGSTSADMVIIAAPRRQLRRWVRNPSILNASGAQIAIAGKNPVKLVLTGDTDIEVLAAAKAFASASFPESHARHLKPARFLSTQGLNVASKRIAGKTALSSLGASQFTNEWRPRPQQILFDVTDPAAISGKLNLFLQIGAAIDPSSRLEVSLNGQLLEAVPLKKSKLHAKLAIPRGLIKGLDNRLFLTPHLTSSSAIETCGVAQTGPALILGTNSTITIIRDSLSDEADLSVFAASGAPFASSDNTPSTVLISTSSNTERAAALRILAQLSRASRQGWVHANIVDAEDAVWPKEGPVLIIGSNLDLPETALSGAPRSLKTALSGNRYQDPVIKKMASSAPAQHNLLAARETLSGGVAALYRGDDARMIGIITQTKQQSFPKAMNDLLAGEHWNALEGSVARWDNAKVAMAQTALAPKPFAKKRLGIFEGFDLREINTPNLDTFQAAASEKWTVLVKTLKAIWDKPEASMSLPLEVKRAENQKVSNRLAAIPTPRLKPITVTPMMVGLRRVAVPTAPREDIFPKIDVWMAEAGAKIGAGFGGLSQQVSGAVKATPLGDHPANASASPKLLVFALGIIILLIMTVFVSPAKGAQKQS